MKGKLKFTDLKTKKPFSTNKYMLKSKKIISKKTKKPRMMYYAMTTSPSGRKTAMIVSADTYKANK